jgi:hypothetical protein
VLGEPGFDLFIVFLFLFVFGWPFLTVPMDASPRESFLGLFLGWLLFIAVLFFRSRA